MVRQPKRMASSTAGSSAAPSAAAKDGRSASSRDQKSVVSCGRGNVLGPEACRSTERVLRKSGSRGVEVWGVRVPLERGGGWSEEGGLGVERGGQTYYAWI